MLTLLLQLSNEAHVSEDERICFWMISTGFTKTRSNNLRGTKDPPDSAEAFVRLLEAKKGTIAAWTFWEFEEGHFSNVPW